MVTVRDVIEDCHKAAKMYRQEWRSPVSPDSVAMIYERIAHALERALALPSRNAVMNETSRDWDICRAVDLYCAPRNEGDERTLSDFLTEAGISVCAQCAPTVTDEMVIAASKALMNTFIKKWFLGSYKGPVYLDCVNGEKSWENEARAALIAALTSTECGEGK